MHCIKCGREIHGDNLVFCNDCVADFEAYPVKPGTPIQLPHQAPPVNLPKKIRRISNSDDQVAVLTGRVRIMTTAFIIVLIAFFAVAVLCLLLLEARSNIAPL